MNEECMDEYLNERMYRWINEWMRKWLTCNEWINEWMNENELFLTFEMNTGHCPVAGSLLCINVWMNGWISPVVWPVTSLD